MKPAIVIDDMLRILWSTIKFHLSGMMPGSLRNDWQVRGIGLISWKERSRKEPNIDRGADQAERIPFEPDLGNASVGSGV
jgi:hypothetical protein